MGLEKLGTGRGVHQAGETKEQLRGGWWKLRVFSFLFLNSMIPMPLKKKTSALDPKKHTQVNRAAGHDKSVSFRGNGTGF